MHNFSATLKSLGLYEAIQAAVAISMSGLSHFCNPGVGRISTFILATGVLLFQWQRGWSNGKKANAESREAKNRERISEVELKRVLMKFNRECGEDEKMDR